MPDLRCAALILAAGASTRLGQPKQLIRIDGETLLHRTARLAIEAGCSPVFVVLGSEAARLQPELAGLDVDVVPNPVWQEGMGSSLRAGIEAIRELVPPPEAALVLVCDQPRLTTEHLRSLLAHHAACGTEHETGITASAYAGSAGVPAIFPSRLFSVLAAIQGDRGARDVIAAHAAELKGIPWPAGIFDIDRPEDLTTIER